MKRLTVSLPDALAAKIEAEARKLGMSKSEVVRDRLTSAISRPPASFDDIAHLIGSVKSLPTDLSANAKRYLRAGYGRKRPRRGRKAPPSVLPR